MILFVCRKSIEKRMEEFILNLLHYSYSPTLKVFEANALIVYRCLNLQRDFKNTVFGVEHDTNFKFALSLTYCTS